MSETKVMKTAWLIERKMGGSPIWYRADNTCPLGNWTTDACHAVHFATKEDAREARDLAGLFDAEVTEHGFDVPAGEGDDLPPEALKEMRRLIRAYKRVQISEAEVARLTRERDAALAEVERLKAELEKRQPVVSRETVEKAARGLHELHQSEYQRTGVSSWEPTLSWDDLGEESQSRRKRAARAVLTAAGLRVEGEPAANLPAKPDSSLGDYDQQNCQCYECLSHKPSPAGGMSEAHLRMVLCPLCGNKRCPHATHHDYPCSGSNEPGQLGSRYVRTPDSSPELSDEELGRIVYGKLSGLRDYNWSWGELTEHYRNGHIAAALAVRDAVRAADAAEIERLKARVAELEGAIREHWTKAPNVLLSRDCELYKVTGLWKEPE